MESPDEASELRHRDHQRGLKMKSKVSRIFIVDGIEYRIKENQDVGNLPKHVQDKLVSLGLVHVEKSTRKTGRRKKQWQLK